MKRYGHSKGSWVSADNRWVFDREGPDWMILPNGSLSSPLDQHLEKFGLANSFPSRRAAIEALEASMAEITSPLPSLEESEKTFLFGLLEDMSPSQKGKTLKELGALANLKSLTEEEFVVASKIIKDAFAEGVFPPLPS
jgi:hypothetical protein